MKKTLSITIHADVTSANDDMIEALKAYWRAAFKDNTVTFEVQEEAPLNLFERITQEFLSSQDNADEH